MEAGSPRGDAAPVDRDRETLRRAFRAARVVGAAIALALIAAVLALGGDPLDVVGALLLAVHLAALTASGWLLLAAALDLHAGHQPGRRRIRVTALVTVFALFVAPVLVLAGRGGQ